MNNTKDFSRKVQVGKYSFLFMEADEQEYFYRFKEGDESSFVMFVYASDENGTVAASYRREWLGTVGPAVLQTFVDRFMQIQSAVGDADVIKVLRWVKRGLFVDHAVHKVKVDKEIATNIGY